MMVTLRVKPKASVEEVKSAVTAVKAAETVIPRKIAKRPKTDVEGNRLDDRGVQQVLGGSLL